MGMSLRRLIGTSWIVAGMLFASCGDAGPATPPDAGPGRIICTSDAQCDNGVFCDGAELCAPASASAGETGCVSPTAGACLDDQVCNEAARSCETQCDVVDDADGDGVVAVECGGLDCDDADANRFPGNTEVCDAEEHDEDCDATTFGQRDVDGDGWIRATCCNRDSEGVLFCGEDCDDNDRTATPISPEVCDSVDNDCDGFVDERVARPGFVDADFDLHGDASRPLEACPGTPGWSPVGDDCDDADRTRFFGTPEEANGRDDDCDGAVDEAVSVVVWYRDSDGDGYGNAAGGTLSASARPEGFSAFDSDCDDQDAAINPAAPELCNARDDDCDGRANYAIDALLGNLEDDDADGFPDAACAPSGVPGDCDDDDPFVRPGAAELLGDLVDNDCDGGIDDRCVVTELYLDADGDGFGDPADSVRDCNIATGRVPRAGDCNDTDPDVNPAVVELCNDTDDDCDDEIDETASSRCDMVRAIGECIAGSCALVACELGYTDCDSDGLSCEVNTRQDVASCGGCGPSYACTESGAFSRPACVEFACTLSCDAGYDDCDGEASTGCERRILDDPAHCGRCDRACDSPVNGRALCVDRECAAECDPGWDDCNGDLALDGCETLTELSLTDCGACNDPCGSGQTCAGGACVGLPFPSDESDGDELIVASGETLILDSRVHQYRRIVVDEGGTILASGSGRLELRATEDILINGTVDVSGGSGGSGSISLNRYGGGGDTGTRTRRPANGRCTATPGIGGLGAAGGDDAGGCGSGGMFGGGAGGVPGGGGGGGYAGGGGASTGEAEGGAGASASGDVGGAGGANQSGLDPQGGGGGVAPAPYGGEDGVASDANAACGGGGSIGASAAADLLVTSTFRPGSAGGGGAGDFPGGGGRRRRCAASRGGPARDHRVDRRGPGEWRVGGQRGPCGGVRWCGRGRLRRRDLHLGAAGRERGHTQRHGWARRSRLGVQLDPLRWRGRPRPDPRRRGSHRLPIGRPQRACHHLRRRDPDLGARGRYPLPWPLSESERAALLSGRCRAGSCAGGEKPVGGTLERNSIYPVSET